MVTFKLGLRIKKEVKVYLSHCRERGTKKPKHAAKACRFSLISMSNASDKKI